jgi:hypothetical protein
MRTTSNAAASLWVGFALWFVSLASHAAELVIPDPLKSWQSWALQGEEFRRCPFFANQQPNSANEFICAWPERLTLEVNARGGDFTQRWQVFAESWVKLPGSVEHWPRVVKLNGVAAPVIERDGVPTLRLGPGAYSISGTFQWSSRPEQLAIPQQTGIVELSVDGRTVPQPERPGGAIWLGKRREAEQQQQTSMQVYRLLRDDVPAFMTTQIRLQVAGEAREAVLGQALPQNFVPMAINSLLPARIEVDGTLRVQLRPGQWMISIESRATSIAAELKAAISDQASEEIWSFLANDRLRVTAVEGVTAIDPAQANVPAEWRGLPAYRMTKDSTMTITERSRGLANQDANQLQLHRQLWLDFEHGGYTVVDTITGTMRQAWRLDMATPYRALSARIGAENLLVTSAGPDLTGIELRMPNLDLQATGRLEQSSGRMAATGWQTRFASVSGQLNLPPGHHLLAAFGEVDAPTSWASRWSLLDFFLVLIVAVSAWKLRSVVFGVVSLAALVLVHQEQATFAWLMLNLLAAVALARVAPIGKLQTAMTWYRNGSFAVIVLAFVPFAIDQVRLAIYPQLETPFGSSGFGAGAPEERLMEAKMLEREATIAPQVAMAPSQENDAAYDRNGSSRRPEFSPSATEQVTQRYAPGTVVQAGPGVPNWYFNPYRYSWSGPVDASETVRFVIASPFWMFLWRVLGIAALGAFVAGVAQISWQQLRIATLRSALLKSGAAVAMVFGFATFLAPYSAHSQIPDAAVLTELRTRLTQPPACAPACAETLSAAIAVTTDRLDLTLEVSALANVAIPIPIAVGRWEPESISVDGQSAGALYRDPQQNYWLALRSGAHTLRLSGRLAAAESMQLVFPQKPRAVSAGGTGWEFSGINDGRMLTNALELVRVRSSATTDRLAAATAFAPFVSVRRHVRFDLDWTATTVVERIAPDKGAITVEVPLLPGESVLTAGLTPRERNGIRTVQVGLTGGERSVSWESALPRAAVMQLVMAEAQDRTEVWSFAVSPIWNVQFEGVPQIEPDVSGGQWTFDYLPRGGESLKLQIVRPETAGDQTLALDSVRLQSNVGRRATDSVLSISYRSTQGGRHTISLPLDAQVTAVTADGSPIPVRPQDGQLSLGLLPGAHSLEVQWQTDRGAGFRTSSPIVDLKTSASNITTQLNLGGERWVLYARGQGVGPAILYWGELLVFIAIALLLGRYTKSPLRTHDWLLLGLGLSTFSWSVLLIFAVWVFAMQWRANKLDAPSHARFNLLQVALAALSIFTVGGLIAAIPTGLLQQPDMSVRSPSDGFAWFLDQAQGALPPVALYSVPLMVYKIAILLWALWLSFALLRWLPWAWGAFAAGGIWRGRVAKTVAPPI